MPLKISCKVNDNEKHELDVNCLLYHNGNLYSGADDGKVKAWSTNLNKLAEVQSNSCSVYCLAANENSLYSCSNEGTIKSFELDTLKEKRTLIQDPQVEFWKLQYADGCLYSGDHQGNVIVWKNEKIYGSLNMSEPVKDMVISKNLLFTVNLDLVVTDLKLESKKLQFGLKTSFNGSAPLAIVGNTYFAFVSREGTDIIVHENNGSLNFKKYANTKGAHEKIINAIAGTTWNNQNIIFSGGWDKNIKKWIIGENAIKLDATIDVDIVVTTIEIGAERELFVAGSDGHIIRLEDK